MSENIAAGSTAAPTEVVPTEGKEIVQDKMVSVQALLDVKNKNKTLEDQLKKYKDKETKELESQNQYKQLYETTKAEYDKLNAHISETEKNINISKRIRDELTKLGLDSNYQDDITKLIDHSKITWEPDTKTVLGAEFQAKAIYDRYKDTSFFKKGNLNVNQSAPAPIGNLNKPRSQMTTEEKLKQIVAAPLSRPSGMR